MWATTRLNSVFFGKRFCSDKCKCSLRLFSFASLLRLASQLVRISAHLSASRMHLGLRIRREVLQELALPPFRVLASSPQHFAPAARLRTVQARRELALSRWRLAAQRTLFAFETDTTNHFRLQARCTSDKKDSMNDGAVVVSQDAHSCVSLHAACASPKCECCVCGDGDAMRCL